jgi:uncharacterized membrane protein YphA (DoxX/SURF4 family)
LLLDLDGRSLTTGLFPDYTVIYLTFAWRKVLEHATLVLITEAILRVILGWRFLISGLSNLRRWPNPVQTARILFPKGATLFGSIATLLMVMGGLGVAAGFQTPLCALMLLIFLVPTFALHFHWLKILPLMSTVVKDGLDRDKKALDCFQKFDRQAYHAHEVGVRDNVVLFAAAAYFVVRGSAAYGLDSWLSDWTIRLF